MGYLKCKSCGGRYDLQPGELPGEFESCQCGGKLEFYDNHGHKRGYPPIYPNVGSKENSLLVKLVIFLVVAYAVFQVGGRVVMGLIGVMGAMGHPWGTYLFIIFLAICITTILGLLWFLFRKR